MIDSAALSEVFASVCAGIAAGLFLNLVYFGIQASWPENYSTIRNVIDEGARGSLLKYALLRFLPTYVTATFTTVTLVRLNIIAWPALALLLIVHLASTNARALRRLLWTHERGLRNTALVIYHFATGFLLCATVVVAVVSSDVWSPVIPRPTELTNALWTGAFAAVVAAAIQRILRFQAASTVELIGKARRDAGHGLWEEIPEIAQNNGCDPALMQAIVGAECLQRPAWVRRIERIKGAILRNGTYGVAQIGSPTPLDDRESIGRLCQNFRGYFPERSKWGHVLRGRMMARLESHNENPQFVRHVIDFYQELVPYPVAKSDEIADDHRPVIEVAEIKRIGQVIRITGTAVVYEGTLVLDAKPSNGVAAFITGSRGGPLRGDWSVEVPLATRNMRLSEPAMEEGLSSRAVAMVDVDLTDP